jgi:transposase
MPGVEGPGGSACRLDEARLAELRTALEAGPAAHGWAQDQRWTLARAAALVARLFGVSYTLRGMSFLLHRIGYSPQVPVHTGRSSATRPRSPSGGR